MIESKFCLGTASEAVLVCIAAARNKLISSMIKKPIDPHNEEEQERILSQENEIKSKLVAYISEHVTNTNLFFIFLKLELQFFFQRHIHQSRNLC